jgi:translation initiation factor IF-3
VVDLMEAQQMARAMNLDLIEVAATADPPVCRIFDFGKFNFEREKKEREAKKAQKNVEVKGIRLRPKTSEHHLYFKIRAARRFLEAGNKVQVTERFKGREDRIQHVALAMMEKVREGCLDIANVETQPRMEGRTMLMILVPNPATLQAVQNRTTQDRLQREKAEDEAKGYREEDEEHDIDDDENDEEQAVAAEAPTDKPEDRVQAAQATVAADAHATIDFSDKEARRKFNKSKRDRNRDMEQFGLP